MATIRIGYFWHLRWLENYTALFLKKKELSSYQTIRDSENIPKALKHAEAAINQPRLLDDNEKLLLKEYVSDLSFIYKPCKRAIEGSPFVKIVNNKDWLDTFLAFEARIEGIFFPAIQKMSISKVIESHHEHLVIYLKDVFKRKSKVLYLIEDLANSPENKVKHDPSRHGDDAKRTIKRFLETIGKEGYKSNFHCKGGYISCDIPIIVIKD